MGAYFADTGIMDMARDRYGTNLGPDIHGPKPYKIIRFGDVHGPKPYKSIWFGDIHGPKPYKSLGFVAMDSVLDRFSAPHPFIIS